jgi:hypothetical protein
VSGLKRCRPGYLAMYEATDGAWVRFEDYQAEREEVAQHRDTYQSLARSGQARHISASLMANAKAEADRLQALLEQEGDRG